MGKKSKLLLVLVIATILLYGCKPEQTEEDKFIKMQSFNNPQGIITALETTDKKLEVTRKLSVVQYDEGLEMDFSDSYTFQENLKENFIIRWSCPSKN